MDEKERLFLYLLENYANYKNKNAKEILSLWDELNLTDYIKDMYERYHIERIENAFEDIDKLIEEKKKHI